jgi:hypothetical protein
MKGMKLVWIWRNRYHIGYCPYPTTRHSGKWDRQEAMGNPHGLFFVGGLRVIGSRHLDALGGKEFALDLWPQS